MTLYNEVGVAYNSAISYNGSPTPPGVPASPVPQIRVAFGIDPLTTPGAASWTDVTDYCRGFDIRRGKTHELDQSQAGEATVILKNTDRRFDPAYASSPYWPNVVPMRRLQVRVVYNSVTYNLFEGFIEDWGQDWPSRVQANAGDAEVVIKVVDAFTMLGKINLTPYASEVFADDPVGYWRLDEDQGVLVRSEGSVDAEGAYVGNVLVGTTPGPLVGGAPVASFQGSIGDAYATLGAPEDLMLTGDLTIEAWVFPSEDTGQIVQGFHPYALLMNSGAIRFGHTTNGGDLEYVFDDTSAPLAGAWHHFAAVRDASARTLTIYVDGVQTAQRTYTRAPATDLYELMISGRGSDPPGLLVANSFDGKLAHVAIYDKALDPTRIAAHFDAPFDRFAEVASGAHIGQILDLAGWPSGERHIDAGVSEIAGVSPEGPALDWLLAVAESTERGLFRVAPNGDVEFTDRQAIVTQTSAATFGDGGGAEVAYTDIDVRNDDGDLYSSVTVIDRDGIGHTASDAASAARYGPRTLELSGSLAANAEESVDEATYLLQRFRSPTTRVERLEFLAGYDGSTLVQLFTRDLGDRVTVKRRPPGGGTITQDCRIEGLHHQHRPNQPWFTEWATDPVDPTTYFILNTSLLDGVDVLAY